MDDRAMLLLLICKLGGTDDPFPKVLKTKGLNERQQIKEDVITSEIKDE